MGNISQLRPTQSVADHVLSAASLMDVAERHGLTYGEAKVLAQLSRLVDRQGMIETTRSALAAAARCNERNLTESIRRLEEFGAIKRAGTQFVFRWTLEAPEPDGAIRDAKHSRSHQKPYSSEQSELDRQLWNAARDGFKRARKDVYGSALVGEAEPEVVSYVLDQIKSYAKQLGGNEFQIARVYLDTYVRHCELPGNVHHPLSLKWLIPAQSTLDVWVPRALRAENQRSRRELDESSRQWTDVGFRNIARQASREAVAAAGGARRVRDGECIACGTPLEANGTCPRSRLGGHKQPRRGGS